MLSTAEWLLLLLHNSASEDSLSALFTRGVRGGGQIRKLYVTLSIRLCSGLLSKNTSIIYVSYYMVSRRIERTVQVLVRCEVEVSFVIDAPTAAI